MKAIWHVHTNLLLSNLVMSFVKFPHIKSHKDDYLKSILIPKICLVTMNTNSLNVLKYIPFMVASLADHHVHTNSLYIFAADTNYKIPVLNNTRPFSTSLVT